MWVGTSMTKTRPATQKYLECENTEWDLKCGIESWFVSQGEATSLKKAAKNGSMVAVVKVDDRGNGALVDVRADG